ncbi:MAG: PAS domain S-box protein [Pseudomonadota bacterium]
MDKKNILIVDDDPRLRKTLSDILKAKGYTPITVAEGKEALDKAREGGPVLALIDFKLEDMSGLEVIKGIKEYSPRTECIVITGYASQESAIEAVNLGAYSYVRKPYDMDQLLLTVQRAIEKQEAEESLRESEEKYREVVETSVDGVISVDSQSKVIVWNKGAERIFGYTAEEMLGQSVMKIVPERYTKALGKGFAEFPKSGTGPVIGGMLELPGLRKDGTEVSVELSVSSRKKNETRIATAIVRDISDRKMAAEKLRRSESDLRLLIGKNVDGLIIVDSEGILRFMNPAAESLFGRKSENLIGKDMGLPLVSGEATEMEISGKDGVQYIVEMRSASINWEEKDTFLVSLRDITDRKRAEENLRKSLLGAVQAIASIVELKDPYTAGHQRRVSALAWTIAQEMGLTSEQAEGIRIAGMIHDIGKVSVPTEILSKPGKISALEFSLIKEHVQSGYDILKDLDFPWSLDQMILQHHERMNGSGYPQGLSGKDMLLEARILAVADVVEAMATDRPYRPAIGLDQALDEIVMNRGVVYDSEAVDVCLRLFQEKGFKFDA